MVMGDGDAAARVPITHLLITPISSLITQSDPYRPGAWRSRLPRNILALPPVREVVPSPRRFHPMIASLSTTALLVASLATVAQRPAAASHPAAPPARAGPAAPGAGRPAAGRRPRRAPEALPGGHPRHGARRLRRLHRLPHRRQALRRDPRAMLEPRVPVGVRQPRHDPRRRVRRRGDHRPRGPLGAARQPGVPAHRLVRHGGRQQPPGEPGGAAVERGPDHRLVRRRGLQPRGQQRRPRRHQALHHATWPS